MDNDALRDELLKGLCNEVQELRELTHLQVGQIRGLASYCVRRIQEFGDLGREGEFELLGEYIKKSYDEYLGSLEDDYPGLAARVDIRSKLPEADQDSWYRLT